MAPIPERLTAALAGRYLIERELGRGGAAVVYLARDLRHDRFVALKVLDPELSQAIGAERFQREVRLLARLRHPNILPLLDSGDVDGHLFYAAPFIEGDSLRALLTRTGQLPLAQAVRLGIEIADALAHAHAEGVIHRDIKPENILLEADHAVVADFGIAIATDHATGARLTGTGLAIGTPAYMSPEQALADAQLDARSDIYSTGCVLYEMLTGEAPYLGSTAQAIIARRLSSAPAPVTALRETVPASLERAVMTALARSAADRFQTAAELRTALEAVRGELTARGARPVRPRVPLAARVGIAVAAALSGAALWFGLRTRPAPSGLDANLVAIAPFEVLDPALGLWKQGLVDVLAANLDGAGPLRTVPPTVIMRRWSGRADRASAAAVAKRAGAGIAIFGRLETSGPDSVRCTVWIDEPASGKRLGEVELRERVDRMDQLGDSLSLAIVRELAGGRPMGTVRLGSLGSHSMPAIKLYLQGEQYFRRGGLDSARAAFEHAVTTDSSFGLAINRLGVVMTWQGTAYSHEANEVVMRAARFASGLAPRDSLQLTADALSARLLLFEPDTAWWTGAQELLQTWRVLSRRSPNDASVWNAIGEMHFHLRGAIGGSWDEAQAAFDRAISLDSAFAPAYLHPVSMALGRDDREGARRYLAGLRRLQPPGKDATWPQLIDAMLGSEPPSPGELDRRLAALPTDELFDVWAAVANWTDSAEAAIRAARAMARARASGIQDLDDPGFARRLLLESLLDRGHFREALRLGGGLEAALPVLATMGVIARDSADLVFGRWLREGNRNAHTALLWWAESGDSSAIRRLSKAAAVRARSGSGVERHFARFEIGAAEAYLALARRDTTRAITLLRILPDSLCPECFVPRLTLGQLLVERHLDGAADTLLRRDLTALPFRGGPAEVLWRLARARLAERQGERDRAATLFTSVARLLRYGDPEARRMAAEAERRALRLSASPPGAGPSP